MKIRLNANIISKSKEILNKYSFELDAYCPPVDHIGRPHPAEGRQL